MTDTSQSPAPPRQPRPNRVLLFLSAPPEQARAELESVLESHRDSRITVYVRDAHRAANEDLLARCFVHSDKPRGGRLAFIRELRAHFFDEVIVLDFGQWSFYPSRCLFFLARAKRKTVRTERGSFELGLLALCRHLLYRVRHRSGAVAGMPPGMPFPFVFAAYRASLGLLLGTARTVVEYGLRVFR